MTSKKLKAAEFVGLGYSINITGRNVLVTDAMKDYVIEKIAKIEKFSNRINDVHVIMDIQKLDQRIDIVMRVGHFLLKAHASSNDMYASIDKAIDKLQSQFRRYKTKLQNHNAKPLEVIDMRVNVLKAPHDRVVVEMNDAIDEENARIAEDVLRPHEVVSVETMPMKVLTTDEAVMKMELSGDDFLIFRNEVDRKLNVIYRRGDGNYGIIYPEG